MSRGFGAMQRDILQAYDDTVPGAKGVPIEVQDPWGARYTPDDAVSVHRLQRDVAQRRGYWYDGMLEMAFQASFSRALHGLIRRGVLVKVSMLGLSGVWCLGRVAYVVRVKR